jgi:hypothetical protein
LTQLTPAADTVDGTASLLSITQIAALKHTSKQAVSKRVKRLLENGLLAVQRGPNGSLLINLAEYDRVVGETTDFIRAANGTQKTKSPELGSSESPASPSLNFQQARKASYDADLKKLELDERLGKLLPIKDVEAAMIECASSMVRQIEQISARAEDIAAAVARNGAAGARAELKRIVHDLRETLARELRVVARQSEDQQQADPGTESVSDTASDVMVQADL